MALVVAPCQDQEKALDKYEAVVQSLQERSQQVLPLRFRRQTPPQPVPVEALCEYEGEQVRPPHGHPRATPRPPQGHRGPAAGHGCRGTEPSAGTAVRAAPGEGAGFSKRWWWLRQGNRAKVALAPVGRAGLAAEEREGSGAKAASLPLTPSGRCESSALSHSHAPWADVPASS